MLKDTKQQCCEGLDLPLRTTVSITLSMKARRTITRLTRYFIGIDTIFSNWAGRLGHLPFGVSALRPTADAHHPLHFLQRGILTMSSGGLLLVVGSA
jgi:hypothetical protein